MHQDEHGAARGAGQGLLHPGGHRREVSSSGRGHGCGDEPERGLGHTGSGLHGWECVGEGREDYPELYRGGEQNGLEKILIYESDLFDPVSNH